MKGKELILKGYDKKIQVEVFVKKIPK